VDVFLVRTFFLLASSLYFTGLSIPELRIIYATQDPAFSRFKKCRNRSQSVLEIILQLLLINQEVYRFVASQ